MTGRGMTDPMRPFDPARLALYDGGGTLQVWVVSRGAVSIRIVAADGTEVVADLTEGQTAALLADVDARRAVTGSGPFSQRAPSEMESGEL